MNFKKYSKAIQFAAIAHEGTYRKGTKIPYITHVLEAGLIAMSLTNDEDTIVAAILHDVAEDTPYDLADIENQFGSRVADLVAYESEDKMHDIPAEESWKNRKELFLNHLQGAPLEAKIICLADKLSNIRMSVKTHAEKGDDMWLVFNQKDKKEQEWYYRSIPKKIPELENSDAYKEYVKCCDEVFGKQEIYIPGKNRSKHNRVMYDPLIPDYARMNGLVDFVSDEIDDILQFFNDIEIAEDLVMPYVFLSDKISYRSYGKLSDNEIIEALKEYAAGMKRTEMYDYFQNIINTIIQNLELDIKSREECREQESEWSDLMLTMSGAERAVLLEGSDEDKAIMVGIIKILSSRRVGNMIKLGEYLPDRHQIIIYYNAIEREINRIVHPDMDFYAKLSSVIAHEFFHAMHHAMAPGYILWNNSSYKSIKGYQKKEIKEALADFFSVAWCYEQATRKNRYMFMDVAKERFDSWRKYLYSAWPYAKALYLMKDNIDKRLPIVLNDEAIRKGHRAMISVLTASVNDIERSYKLLKG